MNSKTVNQLKLLYGVNGIPKELPGGQGNSFLIDNLVFKLIEDTSAYEKIMEIFSTMETNGYKINTPVRSKNGRFCELGYGVTVFEDGETCSGRLSEKLYISEMLHRDTSGIDITVFPHEDHKWERANNVLWRRRKLPGTWTGKRKELCRYLLSNLDEVNEPYQVIHGDLGGNILFRKNDVPLVIDISPTIAPKKYADAIIINDAIAWEGQSLDSMYLLKPFSEYIPFLKYAVVFRILTIAFSKKYDIKIERHMLDEWKVYRRIWDEIVKTN